MMLRFRIGRSFDAILWTVLIVALAGCQQESAPPGETSPAEARDEREYPYQITATVGMVADIVRQVAGEYAEVDGLIGEGVDPHLYKPTRDDVTRLMGADVVFYSGLMLEGKLGDVLIKVAQRKPVYAVTELLDEQYLLEPEEFEGLYDPHVWMDPDGWSRAVEAVADSLAEYDPAHAERYHANAEAYVEQLEALDAWAQQAIETIPERSRILITAHDAFNYFGRAYGLEVKGIQGLSTESEAGLDDVRRLVDTIVDNEISAVFVETSVSDKNVRALIEGAAARGHEVRIGGTLYSDAMGAPGTYEGTYIGMIDHNVTTIVGALGGEVDPGGFQGKLRRGEKES